MTRTTIRLPDDVEELLNRVSREKGVNRVDLIRRVFTIFKIVVEEQKKGHFLAIARPGLENAAPQVTARIVGFV